ncbi:substrate-binding domain-containing protein [Chitinophaga sp. SYP-B3965]|uniref:LacI family DNA-binding transcriptional regulator n=1 Tax=Chitinophaga sp. SYP-B3965 TaxID=2663120 RepID=UPI001299E73C|nr:LacI family DNA-binding transcriptional regulator [Chitinophaga sp. SYP-B3965]MRG44270.1 substrate-binding domain-containing protein [Chitinophaga sp. SYP-B3965]
MSKVNIKQLAKELNLSISTVSRALRDSYEISADTKKKVFALAKQLNYQPNPNASGLRGQKTKTIAVVIPEMVNDFFSLVIGGIEKVAQEQGYYLLFYFTHGDYDLEVSFINTLANGRVDGVLLSMSRENHDNSHLLELNKNGIPLVLFDRVSENLDNVKVTSDNYDSAITATRHLIDAGCKKIAYLQVHKNISIGKIRMNGYLEALRPKGQTPLMVECSNENEETFEIIEKMLLNEKPDGIFASVEKLAVICYRVCEKINLRIPRDIKIISFSNLQTASLLNPSLTTITQPAFDIGETAAKELLDIIHKKSKSASRDKHVILKSLFIKRKSTSALY